MNLHSNSIPATSVTRLIAGLLSLVLLPACEPAADDRMVGTLERDRIELKVEISEPITDIAIRDGQQVKAGDLVLVQDNERAAVRKTQAVAARNQAAARLAELERGPRQEAIKESRARLDSLHAITVNAAAELERVQEVFARQLGSQANLDAAEAAWKSARSQEAAARESLAALLIA